VREGTPRFPVPAQLNRALDAQLDLRRVESDDSLSVYENVAWIPGRAQLPPAVAEASQGTGPDAVLHVELAGAPPVLPRRSEPARFAGDVATGEVFLSQSSSSGWRLRVAGEGAPRRKAFGWANAFTVPAGGRAVLSYRTSFVRHAIVIVQAGLWLLAIRTLIRLRLRERSSS
jgi:hypothetical protein